MPTESQGQSTDSQRADATLKQATATANDQHGMLVAPPAPDPADTCYVCNGGTGSKDLMCELCDQGIHVECLPAPVASLDAWFCGNCVFTEDKSEAYAKWLGQNGLINVLGQLGAYTDDKGHLHRGKFILPSREEYDTARNMHLHKRTKGLTEGPLPAITLATPYWFKYEKPWRYQGTPVQVEHCTPPFAMELRANLPGRQPASQAPFVFFSAYTFAPNSFGHTLMQSGALSFLEKKMMNHALFELRDHPLPTKANDPIEIKQGIKECMRNVLQLCSQLAPKSVELLSMRIIAETLLHLLCAKGVRATDMCASIQLFQRGQWETLWNLAIKASAKVKTQKANNPHQPRPRTNKQKDQFATKCANAGNFSKANQVICNEALHACDGDTLDKLKNLHPVGDLNFDRTFWPSVDEMQDYWESEHGREIMDNFLSVKKIREYFRRRPPLGAPDIDGWRGREHIAFMLMDDDEDFHELFRTHLILPHVHNDFLAQYSKERAGGHLFAFQKTNGGIRPILCGGIFRRCYASLMSEAYRKEATRHFTESVPNFIQCAGGLRDGSTICAQLLRTFDSEPATVNGTLQALMEIDLVNAFNETSRQAAFDVLAGKASREYDKGQIQREHPLPTFGGLRHLFGYFTAMHDTAGTLRYVGPDGQVHHIQGTSGGQQGDPLEMMRFCATIHPVWARVMGRFAEARGLAFADDGFVRASLFDCLHILAELKLAFKEDAGLDICLPKCKIYLNELGLDEARDKVKTIIDEHHLDSIRDILDKDVVQVEGMVCVGVPIGSPQFVQAFVTEKTTVIMEDVKKLQILTDPLIHFELVRFCHNTRLSYLSRNLSPEVMTDMAGGVQSVDQTIVDEILRRGTDDCSNNWTQQEKNWHIVSVQLPHHKAGLGLTPQQAAGIGAFYSATTRFVRWVANRPSHWIRANQRLDDPTTWSAANLVDLNTTHQELIEQYHCVEATPGADDTATADTEDAQAAAPLSLPPLNLLAKHNLSDPESGAGCSPPTQRQITTQVMRFWGPHLEARAPNTRCQDMRALHCAQTFPATSRVQEGADDHSILQDNMPEQEAPDDDASKTRKLHFSPTAWLSCLSSSATMPFDKRTWISFFCQFLGVPIPALEKLANKQYVCACGRHTIDGYGDHIHSCKHHTGSIKAAHEQVLDAIQGICKQAGVSTIRRGLPVITKPNGKSGSGDLVLKDVWLGGHRDLVIDVAINHEFGGNHMQNVGQNGSLRSANPAKILEATARTKINRYRDAYATTPGTTYAFLPCVISTSGRIHGEFLRLLYILAHRQTERWFDHIGDRHPSTEAFTWRRGEYFWRIRAAIGCSAARATGRRTCVAPHTIRRRVAIPHMRDLLYFPLPPTRAH